MHARRRGVDIRWFDLLSEPIPPADYVVMCSSLYHFGDRLDEVIGKMRQAARRAVIVSEPVRNLSDAPLVGRLAAALTNPGVGAFTARFDLDRFQATCERTGRARVRSGRRNHRGVSVRGVLGPTRQVAGRLRRRSCIRASTAGPGAAGPRGAADRVQEAPPAEEVVAPSVTSCLPRRPRRVRQLVRQIRKLEGATLSDVHAGFNRNYPSDKEDRNMSYVLFLGALDRWMPESNSVGSSTSPAWRTRTDEQSYEADQA
jgi:hypothetical protein